MAFRRITICLLLWWLRTWVSSAISTAQKEENTQYELHPEYANAMMNRASTLALFHAKANEMLEELNDRERHRFKICQQRARNVIDMAKCVTRVIDERDKRRESSAEEEISTSTQRTCNVDDDNNDGNWLQGIFFSAYKSWSCPYRVPKQKIPKPGRFEKLRRVQPRQKAPKPHSNTLWTHISKIRPTEDAKTTKMRKKRKVMFHKVFNVSRRCEIPHNVQRLRNVREYFDQMNHVFEFTYNVTRGNERFLRKMDLHVSFGERKPTGKTPYEQLRRSLDDLESATDQGIVSVLSPKIFNILPENPMDGESKRWLSPNVLSFQDEGMVPLPKLFKWSKSDDCETQRWVDILLDATGGTRLLHDITQTHGGHMVKLKEKIYPRVKQVETREEHAERIRSLSTDEQKVQMEKFGFVRMNKKQLDMAYGENGVHPWNVDLDDLHENSDAYLENFIKQLSEMSPEEVMALTEDGSTASRRRVKRQGTIFASRIVSPFTFLSRIFNPNLMGAYIVSPFMGFLSLFSPYVLGLEPLSPQFLIASLFSPQVLLLRVLEPRAMILFVFTPVVMAAWVLVPEALSVKVFSPIAMILRALSPDTLSIVVASPGMGVARIGSPNALNLLILSPSFFTYGLLSGNRYVIQILSPGILGIDANPIFRATAP